MVGVEAELLAVAGDEQQGVVGAGAEDEDADDPAVEAEVERLAHALGHDARDLVGDADDGQRHEPQDRRAVGQQEQQADDADGHEQEAEVGAVEGGRDVGAEGRPARGAGLEPVGQAVRDRRPDAVDDGAELVVVGGVDADRDLEHPGPAVVAHDRPDGLLPGGGREGRGEVAQPLLVGGGERRPVGARGDHDERLHVGAGQLGDEVVDGGGLGRGGGGAVAGGDLGVAQSAHEAGGHEGGQEQGEPGGGAARDQARETVDEHVIDAREEDPCGSPARGHPFG